MAIPKLIHQIWLGGPVPVVVHRWAETWKKSHPDWDYVLWTDDTLPTPESPEAFHRMPTLAGKADLVRLQLLREHGGVYVDADMEAHRSLQALAESRDLMLVSQHGIVCNGIAGAIPQHPFIVAVEQRAIKATLNASEHQLQHPHVLTGPYLWNEVFIDHDLACEDPGVLLPSDYFFEPLTRFPEALERSKLKRYATDHALATWQRRSGVRWNLKRTKLRTRLRRFVDLEAP